MFGKKLWFGERELLRFGFEVYYLSKDKTQKYYDECINAVRRILEELQEYITLNSEFENIGSKMCKTLEISLKKNS